MSTEFDGMSIDDLLIISRTDAEYAGTLAEHARTLRDMASTLQDKVDLVTDVTRKLFDGDGENSGASPLWTGKSSRMTKTELTRLIESFASTPDILNQNASAMDDLSTRVTDTLIAVDTAHVNATSDPEDETSETEARQVLQNATNGYLETARSLPDDLLHRTQAVGGGRRHGRRRSVPRGRALLTRTGRRTARAPVPHDRPRTGRDDPHGPAGVPTVDADRDTRHRHPPARLGARSVTTPGVPPGHAAGHRRPTDRSRASVARSPGTDHAHGPRGRPRAGQSTRAGMDTDRPDHTAGDRRPARSRLEPDAAVTGARAAPAHPTGDRHAPTGARFSHTLARAGAARHRATRHRG